MRIEIAKPYLLFLGDAPDKLTAKTAFGIAYWRPEWCVGQLRLPGCQADLGLPDLTVEDALRRGVRTLVVGIAPSGGQLPAAWVDLLDQALRAGLDIASGLHTRLGDVDRLSTTARDLGRSIHDVRYPSQDFPCGSHRRRPGKRLLTVGTDCAVGKMYTSLALTRAMRARGADVDFRATGQTGILIEGAGVSVDAVISDFVSGAAETLSPPNHVDHWDIIEGQGSLFHPSYAAVSLGLLHGSQPDALVLCHDAARQANSDFLDLPLPSLSDCAELNLQMARMFNRDVELVGASLNTSAFSDAEARKLIGMAEHELGVPCVDPVRMDVDAIVDRLLGHGGARAS